MRPQRASKELTGRHLVITAGGNREPIDPIRFIGNRSSGKMGFALADAAQERGAQVSLITTIPPPQPSWSGTAWSWTAMTPFLCY